MISNTFWLMKFQAQAKVCKDDLKIIGLMYYLSAAKWKDNPASGTKNVNLQRDKGVKCA